MDIKEAERIALSKLKNGSKTKAAISYDDEFMFIIHQPDDLEGMFDPFFKVNKKTGVCIDFSPQDYENPLEIINALKKSAEQNSNK